MATKLIVEMSFVFGIMTTLIEDGDPTPSKCIVHSGDDIVRMVREKNLNIDEIYLHGNKNFTSQIKRELTNVSDFKQIKIISVE